ncbi:MAG: leucyl aminopeptidase family protein [Thermodesulfovibrionales bacterium]
MIRLKFAEKIEDSQFVSIEFRKQKESHLLERLDGRRSLVIGIEKPEKINHRKAMILARQVISLAKTNKLKRLVLNFYDFTFPELKLSDEEKAELLTVNFELANFEFTEYKTPPEDGWNFVEEIVITGKLDGAVKSAFRRGQIIGEGVNLSRRLANTPAGDLTPDSFAKEVKRIFSKTDVKVKIFNKRDIEQLKMGGILGVSKGSENEPRFIMLKYEGHKGKTPVVLIGKGVTFDSGGLNLKPSDAMSDMHMDMSGAASVVATLKIADELKLKRDIIALIPVVENMPSGKSYHPGDILRTSCGKTIEVLNTDAEGRIILADALCYAKGFKPSLVIDVATLTGAATVALGQRAMAVFSNNDDLLEKVRKLGESSGDYVWPMPLWEEYEEDIKGTFADIANTGKTRYGGAITGAIFLHQFIKDAGCPWIHIDMAPRMTSIEGEYLAKGSSGAPVRLLVKMVSEGL